MLENSSKQEKIAKLKSIIWDYNINPNDLYDLVMGKKKIAGPFNFEKIFIRMLERLFWYDLISILGWDLLKKNLTRDLIEKLRFQELREKYEYIRKILQGEALSLSGWDFKYRQEIKNTLLSNRWYSTK